MDIENESPLDLQFRRMSYEGASLTPVRFMSTKTYPHSLGLSCAFRQWRAKHSHCQFLHGYALEVKLVFGANALNDCNWVVDFGGLKEIKESLQILLDHKTLVAEDDPELVMFQDMHARGIVDLVVVPAVGCEKIAELIFHHIDTVINESPDSSRVWIQSVEVSEHNSNSAIVIRDDNAPS